MKTIEISAAAKLNLSLEITGIRADGYHLLKSVMQTINLSDHIRVTVVNGPSAIRLSCDDPYVPLDSRNTCYKAAAFWLEKSGNNYSILIDIEKQIPSEAGLGGGSADAAAVLKALNKLTGEPLSSDDLFDAALNTGADVPFCLHGGTALCEGIGEVITPLPQMPIKPILLLKPSFGLSTPAVFRMSDQMQSKAAFDHEKVIAAIRAGNWSNLGNACGNMLEQAAVCLQPQLANYLETMRKTDAEMVMMTGSGTCIYAVYSDEEKRDRSLASLNNLPDDQVLLIPSYIAGQQSEVQ